MVNKMYKIDWVYPKFDRLSPRFYDSFQKWHVLIFICLQKNHSLFKSQADIEL